ncbi:DUF4921 family protein [Yimella sp. cx-573]|nr:DUF4921 family protein [Yimella sp. cx-573]
MESLLRLPDGTVKQINPFSGTEVWTVPGRGNRPLPNVVRDVHSLTEHELRHRCAFCEQRYLETTPERARWTLADDGLREQHGLTADEVIAASADFRRVPNLFEILSYDYWNLNYGFTGGREALRREEHYLSTELGRQHVKDMVQARLRAQGLDLELSEGVVTAQSRGFFAGCHDVIIARRHFVDGATRTDQLASSGTLSVAEHEAFVRATIATAQQLYADNPHARYVSIFQNWLAPAGASFEHLHKQAVAIDRLSRRMQRELKKLRKEPDIYRRLGPELARRHGLVIAENEHAIAFAGVGHRYPGIDVYTKVDGVPWELPTEVVRDWSALVRAVHAATGPLVPTNEEWHHQPPGLADVSAPLRAVIKWRINTPAGFEGGTGVFVNTIDPWTLRDRVVERIADLQH